MIRSRTEVMRKRRERRRRRVLAANLWLLSAIAAVLFWNGLSSGKDGQQAVEQPPVDLSAEKRGTVEQEPPVDEEEQEASGHIENEEEPLPEETNEGKAEPDIGKPPGDSSAVRLAFAGDIMLGNYVETLLKRHGFDYPYAQVKTLLQDADVTAANLETAVTAEVEKVGKKQYEFRSPPDALPSFREAGFDLVSLANNHALDFGPKGLRDTIRHLNDNGIGHVGAGENADEAFAPLYIGKNGLKIAFIGLSRVVPSGDWKAGENNLGVADSYDYRRPVAEISAAKKQADLVVVMVHWGNQLDLEADPRKQTELGRRYIDAGADLVIGSHPHVLQGIESYKNKWIVYSLGNFIFTKSKDPLTYDSGILYADCDNTGSCGLQLVPLKADTPQPVPMEAEAASKVLNRVSSLSINAVLDEEGFALPAGKASGNEGSTP